MSFDREGGKGRPTKSHASRVILTHSVALTLELIKIGDISHMHLPFTCELYYDINTDTEGEVQPFDYVERLSFARHQYACLYSLMQ